MFSMDNNYCSELILLLAARYNFSDSDIASNTENFIGPSFILSYTVRVTDFHSLGFLQNFLQWY